VIRAGPRGSGGEPCWGPRAVSLDHMQFSAEHRVAVPTRETAPGPGRSPAPSIVASKVGGIEKMLTSVPTVGPPRRLMELPITVMVRLAPPFGPKAPCVRCSQLSALLSVSAHAPLIAMPFSQHCRNWPPVVALTSKLPVPPGSATSRQKPEKTRVWELAVLPVSLVATVPLHVTVPVVRLNATGSEPIEVMGSGGQSWLVGYDALIAVVPATHVSP